MRPLIYAMGSRSMATSQDRGERTAGRLPTRSVEDLTALLTSAGER
jgi:hypothetical protein